MRTILFILAIFSFSKIEAQNGLSTVISNNPVKNPYNNLILYPGITVDYLLNYHPEKYHHILFQTNAPDQIKAVFEDLFTKAEYSSYEYKALFPNDNYTEEEIKQKITLYQIDCFLKIEYISDVYNSGSKTTVQQIGNTAFAKTRDTKKSLIQLNIQFYNNDGANIPFYKVTGILEGGSDSQIGVSKKILWITLKELKKRGMLL
jgi:hypothetical protein